MKKVISVILVVLMLLTLFGCGKKVNIVEKPSEIYTQKEIKSAIDTAVAYFEKEFEGSTLLEIGYVGDEKGEAFENWAAAFGMDQVIILISSFESVPAEGDEGSKEVFNNWQWILGRTAGGEWEHLVHGYAS